MQGIVIRRLECADIPRFIRMRLNQLAEEGARATCDLAPALAAYYERHMPDGSFASFIALDAGEIVATSGMSFVERPPTFSNPSGGIGILSSMYTLPSHRRRGIAKTLLGKIVEEARSRGCGRVEITASDAGVLLYENFGFQKNGNFMQLAL
jgi:GNAT superfamily N-acetyltransferase